MMALLADYGLFLLKALTLLGLALLFVAALASLRGRRHDPAQAPGRIEVTDLGEGFRDTEAALREAIFPPKAFKAWSKAQAKAHKARAKEFTHDAGKTIYVIDFHGDLQASAVRALREEISAVLAVASSTDEVLLRLESSGGVVHGYGLAASQLQRIRDKGIPLTIAVDKVAASGGYMMACLANHLLVAPFAIVGSIGVVGQLPNFNRLLKKHDIDFELHTAGAYKRTLTVFGENTPAAREKFVAELNETHRLFRNFVGRFRPALDLDKVATGEIWFGLDAMPLKLVDAIGTSDEYLQERQADHRIIKVAYHSRKTLAQRVGLGIETAVDRSLWRWIERALKTRFPA